MNKAYFIVNHVYNVCTSLQGWPGTIYFTARNLMFPEINKMRRKWGFPRSNCYWQVDLAKPLFWFYGTIFYHIRIVSKLKPFFSMGLGCMTFSKNVRQRRANFTSFSTLKQKFDPGNSSYIMFHTQLANTYPREV